MVEINSLKDVKTPAYQRRQMQCPQYIFKSILYIINYNPYLNPSNYVHSSTTLYFPHSSISSVFIQHLLCVRNRYHVKCCFTRMIVTIPEWLASTNDFKSTQEFFPLAILHKVTPKSASQSSLMINGIIIAFMFSGN